jgi:hypothetical protein
MLLEKGTDISVDVFKPNTEVMATDSIKVPVAGSQLHKKNSSSTPDNSCTFNEFINFIELGEAGSSPTHYTLDETYYLTAGTLYALGDAFRSAIRDGLWWDGLILSRISPTSI